MKKFAMFGLTLLVAGCATAPPKEWLVPAYVVVDGQPWFTQKLATIEEAKQVAQFLVLQDRNDKAAQAEKERVSAEVQKRAEQIVADREAQRAVTLASTIYLGSSEFPKETPPPASATTFKP